MRAALNVNAFDHGCLQSCGYYAVPFNDNGVLVAVPSNFMIAAYHRLTVAVQVQISKSMLTYTRMTSLHVGRGALELGQKSPRCNRCAKKGPRWGEYLPSWGTSPAGIHITRGGMPRIVSSEGLNITVIYALRTTAARYILFFVTVCAFSYPTRPLHIIECATLYAALHVTEQSCAVLCYTRAHRIVQRGLVLYWSEQLVEQEGGSTTPTWW